MTGGLRYINRQEYDNSMFSTPKSRTYLQIAAAYVNVAMRAAPKLDELRVCANGPINTTRARAFAVMTNLSFAFEIALKGKIEDSLLAQVNIDAVDRRKGHDLKHIFSKLPHAEQKDLIMEVKNIFVIDDAQFHDLFEQCRIGFVEWRYFFEENNAGKVYDYGRLVPFMYASLYHLFSSELKTGLLENCSLKKKAYIGSSGLLTQRAGLQEEYNDAIRDSLKDGYGQITSDDALWIQGIQSQIRELDKQIKDLEEYYDRDQ